MGTKTLFSAFSLLPDLALKKAPQPWGRKPLFFHLGYVQAYPHIEKSSPTMGTKTWTPSTVPNSIGLLLKKAPQPWGRKPY